MIKRRDKAGFRRKSLAATSALERPVEKRRDRPSFLRRGLTSVVRRWRLYQEHGLNVLVRTEMEIRKTRHFETKNDSLPLPVKVWGTKGFEFWTFLSLLLLHSKCSRILELGSGRSTITLAEYATLRNAQFISIETSLEWFNKARLEIKFLNVPCNPVRLVKLNPATGWYDLDQFHSAVGNENRFDFVFIDGPNDLDGNSQGMRDSELATREILACTANADVVIVDDVHRRHVLDTVDRMLVDATQYEKWFYDYSVHDQYRNSLCVCTKRDSRASVAVLRIQEMLDIRLYRTFDGTNCAQD